VLTQSLPRSTGLLRNFNLCPHCLQQGQPGPLLRLRESMPMISRSDGHSFHLVLADRPLPYPLERSAGPSKRLSLCFWYTPPKQPASNFSTIVILDGLRGNHPLVYRRIETVADLLAEELAAREQLAEVYELFEPAPALWELPVYGALGKLPLPREAR
jgi:hypothetical protein